MKKRSTIVVVSLSLAIAGCLATQAALAADSVARGTPPPGFSTGEKGDQRPTADDGIYEVPADATPEQQARLINDHLGGDETNYERLLVNLKPEN